MATQMSYRRKSRKAGNQFRTVFYFKPTFKTEYTWLVKAEKLVVLKNPNELHVYSKHYGGDEKHHLDILRYDANNPTAFEGLLYGNYDLYVPADSKFVEDEVTSRCTLIDSFLYSMPEIYRESEYVLDQKRKIIVHYWKGSNMFYTLNALKKMRELFHKDRKIDFDKINPFPNLEGTLLIARNDDVLTMYLIEGGIVYDPRKERKR